MAEEMTGMPAQPNPLHLANAAQNMARNASEADARVFQKVAMISMGIMAVASLGTIMKPILDYLNRHEKEKQPDKPRSR